MKPLKAKVAFEFDSQKHIAQMRLEGDTIGMADPFPKKRTQSRIKKPNKMQR